MHYFSTYEKIKYLAELFSIPYKENHKNIILFCPNCYLRDGKEKIKLYIDKDLLIFHCFRCTIKGHSKKLYDVLALYDKIYPGFLDELNKIKADIITNILIPHKPKYNISKEILDEIKNSNISIKFKKIPTKKQKKYLLSRKIKNFNDILFCDYGQKLTDTINLNHSIFFKSFFSSSYQIRFPFSKFNYRLTLFNNSKKFFDFNKNVAYFPDYFCLNLSNSISNLNVIVLEGEFDALSMREILKQGNFLIAASSGIAKFNSVINFLDILKKYYDYHYENLFFVTDDDIEKIKRNKIIATSKKLLTYRGKSFIFNTSGFLGDVLGLDVPEGIKDVNDYLRINV